MGVAVGRQHDVAGGGVPRREPAVEIQRGVDRHHFTRRSDNLRHPFDPADEINNLGPRVFKGPPSRKGDYAVLGNDIDAVSDERRVEPEGGAHPLFDREVLELTFAVVGELGAFDGAGDHVGCGVKAHVFEVDHEIVEFGAVEVDAEHLPAPLRPPIVGVTDIADRLVVRHPHVRNRGRNAVVHRGNKSNLENPAQTLEDELTGESAVDAVAVRHQLAESCLHGEDVALFAPAESLEEVGGHVEAAVHVVFGDPVPLGAFERVHEPDDLVAQSLLKGLGELLGAAVATLRNGDDRHSQPLPSRRRPAIFAGAAVSTLTSREILHNVFRMRKRPTERLGRCILRVESPLFSTYRDTDRAPNRGFP